VWGKPPQKSLSTFTTQLYSDPSGQQSIGGGSCRGGANGSAGCISPEPNVAHGILVELGAGDYRNAIKNKGSFPGMKVYATNLVEE
jgi:hypothetical protein